MFFTSYKKMQWKDLHFFPKINCHWCRLDTWCVQNVVIMRLVWHQKADFVNIGVLIQVKTESTSHTHTHTHTQSMAMSLAYFLYVENVSGLKVFLNYSGFTVSTLRSHERVLFSLG
jgi:hypothetical protein